MIMSRKETKLRICSEFEEGKVQAMSQIDFFFSSKQSNWIEVQQSYSEYTYIYHK